MLIPELLDLENFVPELSGYDLIDYYAQLRSGAASLSGPNRELRMIVAMAAMALGLLDEREIVQERVGAAWDSVDDKIQGLKNEIDDLQGALEEAEGKIAALREQSKNLLARAKKAEGKIQGEKNG